MLCGLAGPVTILYPDHICGNYSQQPRLSQLSHPACAAGRWRGGRSFRRRPAPGRSACAVRSADAPGPAGTPRRSRHARRPESCQQRQQGPGEWHGTARRKPRRTALASPGRRADARRPRRSAQARRYPAAAGTGSGGTASVVRIRPLVRCQATPPISAIASATRSATTPAVMAPSAPHRALAFPTQVGIFSSKLPPEVIWKPRTESAETVDDAGYQARSP